ncbi:MAG: DUF433 domain-containing protein [Defluviitaleaceae bacterium]|nr:DUF433 domain-containing protein [Defluviitaleaceae bacterium]
MEQFPRIGHDPEVMGGKACIKGTRVTVGMIMTLLSEGQTFAALLDEYPYLSGEDIAEALRYSAWLVNSREMDIIPA